MSRLRSGGVRGRAWVMHGFRGFEHESPSAPLAYGVPPYRQTGRSPYSRSNVMLKRILATALLFVLAGVPMLAQSPKVEVSATLGWTFSDGVSGDAVLAGDGKLYDRVDPKDSGSFGLNIGVLLGQAEVGFMWGMQPTKLLISGTSERTLGDQSINTYHGYFGYNFMPDSKVVPYVFGGLGATNFSKVDFQTIAGANLTISSETQFSTTWGAGVKFFPSPRVGVRVGAQFTPTYIKSDAAGWWCDPYWGCYLAGSPQYSNQMSLNGGVVFRF